jgi:hypothetical protein
MKMHLLIRQFAGVFILVSLLLAHYHSPYWLWVTAFVGFNLLQSSFTNFCPLEMILKKLGEPMNGKAIRSGTFRVENSRSKAAEGCRSPKPGGISEDL